MCLLLAAVLHLMDADSARRVAASFFNHSHEDAATFFEGLELVEPGLVSGKTWRGAMPDPGLPRGPVYPLVGVAIKR